MTRTLSTGPPPHVSNGPLIGLLLAQSFLCLVPLMVLGRAIGWPGSLRLPPAQALPLIADHPVALQVGY